MVGSLQLSQDSRYHATSNNDNDEGLECAPFILWFGPRHFNTHQISLLEFNEMNDSKWNGVWKYPFGLLIVLFRSLERAIPLLYSLDVFGINALLFASTFLDNSATISLGTIGGLYNHSAPSTTKVSPLIYPPLPSQARNTAAIPISMAVPSRPKGMRSAINSLTSSEVKPGANFVVPGVLAIGPGAIPTTLMLSHPHSNAKLRVNESMALLAAEACA